MSSKRIFGLYPASTSSSCLTREQHTWLTRGGSRVQSAAFKLLKIKRTKKKLTRKKGGMQLQSVASTCIHTAAVAHMLSELKALQKVFKIEMKTRQVLQLFSGETFFIPDGHFREQTSESVSFSRNSSADEFVKLSENVCKRCPHVLETSNV